MFETDHFVRFKHNDANSIPYPDEAKKRWLERFSQSPFEANYAKI